MVQSLSLVVVSLGLGVHSLIMTHIFSPSKVVWVHNTLHSCGMTPSAMQLTLGNVCLMVNHIVGT